MAIPLINWKITLVISIVSVLILILINGITKGYATTKGTERIDLSQKIYSMAAENIGGFQLIKSYSIEEIRQKGFREANSLLRRLELKFAVIQSLPTPLAEVLIILGLTIILIVFTSNSINYQKMDSKF